MKPVASPPRATDAPSGVPLLDLGRQTASLGDEIVAALARVCRTGAFVLGPEVADLENRIAEYCGARFAVGCASGSDALLLALMAFDVGPGDEVIVPSFTFFATASAVTRLGARPVFADIEPATYNVDAAAVESLLSPQTKAIVPVHLFGQAAEMAALRRIAAGAGVPLIEDAAQAIGAEYGGERVGSMGAVGCLSFYPTKNLGGAGDGGMLTTNDAQLADRLGMLRVHGMRPRYYHEVVGINSRLDAFQAAVLNVKLTHLEHWNEQRQLNAARYASLFEQVGLERFLVLPTTQPGRRHVWNQYVVRVPDGRRDALRQYLGEVGVGSEVYYPLGLHQQECFRRFDRRCGTMLETERAAREVLALPIYPELTEAEQRFVVEQIAAFFEPNAGGHPLGGPKYLVHPAARQQRSGRA